MVTVSTKGGWSRTVSYLKGEIAAQLLLVTTKLECVPNAARFSFFKRSWKFLSMLPKRATCEGTCPHLRALSPSTLIDSY
jgi:hypothetical protein